MVVLRGALACGVVFACALAPVGEAQGEPAGTPCATFAQFVASSTVEGSTVWTMAASRWGAAEESERDGAPLDGAEPRLELSLQAGRIVGLRFPALAVGAGVVVRESHVVFEVRRQQRWAWEGAPVSAGALRVQVWGELSTDAAAMGAASAHDISARARTAASVLWDVPSASAHDTVVTPDLSEIVAEIVAQAGWVEGAPIVLIFRHVDGGGSRWLQAESLWNGLRTPALVVSEGQGAAAAQPCDLVASDCPFSSDDPEAPVPCAHPACAEVGPHRATTCCHAMSAHCDGSADAECVSVLDACADVGKATTAAGKLRAACATEFAECIGLSSCFEQELMPLLAQLDLGAEGVVVAAPSTYDTPEMTKLMICALQFAATPDIEVTSDSCTSTLVATSTFNDTANCVHTGTGDFGVTPGSCVSVDATVATCDLVPGVYSDSDGDAVPDHEEIAEVCNSTLVATVTARDAALCDLSGTVDFGVTPGACSAHTSTATCTYAPGEYASSGNYRGYGFLQPGTPCAAYPCRNGGECTVNVDSPAGFACQCQAGYDGDICEKRVDECASSPCLNGGTCTQTEEIDAFFCLCAMNYRGDTCQDLTGSVGASFDTDRVVAPGEVRGSIAAMLSRPEEHITLTNLQYYVEVDLTVQLNLGHTLPLWHPNADAQLEQAVRTSLAFAPIGFQILSGGSDAFWANVNEHAGEFSELGEIKYGQGFGRRLRSLSANDTDRAAASANSTSNKTKAVQMPADTYGRKLARQLLEIASNSDDRSSLSSLSSPPPPSSAAASKWLDKSIATIKGVEARNHRIDQAWESAGISTPAFAKRGRSKAKKQRAAMEAAKKIEAEAIEMRRRQMQEADAAAAAAKAESTASWSYRLTSDADLASPMVDSGYSALLAAKFNDASAWCRETPVDLCSRDQVDELISSRYLTIAVTRITTAVEYEVLLNDAATANATATATANATATDGAIRLVQELWRAGVPITGSATMQALSDGTCTHGARLPNSDRAAAHTRCRGVIGSTCPYVCDEGYRPTSAALECVAGGSWVGGTCHPENEVLCPASGQWYDLFGPLDANSSGFTVQTDAASTKASISTSQLLAQEPWSSCHNDSSVSISAVCATDREGQYEPCGDQLDVGTHTIILLASKISDASEIRARTSYILTVIDDEPPHLDKEACPSSSVATWTSGLYVALSAVDNSGEVRISACTTDRFTEELAEPPVLTSRRSRAGFIVEPSAVPKTLLVNRCIASSVTGTLVGHLDIAPAGAGQWLVITAEDPSGNADRCHSLMSEW